MSTHSGSGTSAGVLGALEKVQAYTIARRLGEQVWNDTEGIANDARLVEVAAQLVRAVGSVAANVAEGYARKSRPDRIRYYEYALGSVQEAMSWYHTAAPRLGPAIVDARNAALVSIRRLLLVMIRNERASRHS